jgi:hypothetical protein
LKKSFFGIFKKLHHENAFQPSRGAGAPHGIPLGSKRAETQQIRQKNFE